MRIGTIIGALFGFAAGFAVGGSISYFVSESKFNKKMDADYILKREEERKEELKEEPQTEITEEKVEEPATVPEETQYRDISSVLDNYKGKETHTVNYSGYSDPEKSDEVEDMAPIERDDKPYMISEDAFHNTYPEFTKRYLSYYGQSHDLFDEIDGRDVNPADTVGVEHLVNLKKVGVVYVRNMPNGEDYEVKYVDGRLY